VKYKAVLIAQVLIIIGLGTVWIVLGHRFDEERRAAAGQLRVLSNTVSSSLSQLDELRAVNRVLETNLAANRAEYSNELAASKARGDFAAADLARVEAEAQSNDEATAAELSRLDKQIVSIETQYHTLDTQSADLQNSITNLEIEIKGMEKKLAISPTDRDRLLAELKGLQLKKAALEAEFNDLAAARKQLRKVKAEIAAARNYDWVRRGVYAGFHQKGGEKLTHPVVVLPQNTNTIWQMELRQDGSVTVTTPEFTNAPPAH
jgi:chromosome segregation ATPase